MNKFLLFSIVLIIILLLFQIKNIGITANVIFEGGDYEEVSNCEDLQNIQDNLSLNYILTQDIDCTDSINWNGGLGFEPLGDFDSQNCFQGIFEGRSYVIEGVYINIPEESRTGLFSCSSNSQIRNIKLENLFIKGDNYVGGFVGQINEDSTFEDLESSGEVIGNTYVGGLVGYAEKIILLDSNSEVSIQGDQKVGGLIGFSSDGMYLENSNFVGIIKGNQFVGGLVGSFFGGTIKQSYSQATITSQEEGYAIGGLFGNAGVDYLFPNNQGPYIRQSYILNSYSTSSVEGKTKVGGIGGILENAILENSYSSGIINGEENVGGLVGSVLGEDALVLESHSLAIVEVNDVGGGVVGILSSKAKIDSSYSEGSITGKDILGGLVGKAIEEAEISNSYSKNSIEGENIVGGFIGYLENSKVEKSYSLLDIEGEDSVGGLSGEVFNSSINNFHFWGSLEGKDHVGGLVGKVSGITNIKNSSFSGEIEGKNHVGGFVAEVLEEVNIEQCSSTAQIIAQNEVGGMIGIVKSSSSGIKIDRSYFNGSIEAKKHVGGMIGKLDPTESNYIIIDSYARGSLLGQNQVGGLAGKAEKLFIENYYFSGEIEGQNNLGGLMSSAGNNIESIGCYWDTELSGQTSSAIGTGKTTAEMNLIETFAGWDFDSIWLFIGTEPPKLRGNYSGNLFLNEGESHWMNSPPTTNISTIELTGNELEVTMTLAGTSLIVGEDEIELRLYEFDESGGISEGEIFEGDLETSEGNIIQATLIINLDNLENWDSNSETIDFDGIYELYFEVNNNENWRSGILTVDVNQSNEFQMYWGDSGESEITSFQYWKDQSNLVTLIIENSGLSTGDSVNFDIQEEDGICPNDFIRTVTGTVNSEGTVLASWEIQDSDFEAAMDDFPCNNEQGEYVDNDFEFYFETELSPEPSSELNTTYYYNPLPPCFGITSCASYSNENSCEANSCGVDPQLPGVDCSNSDYDCGCSWSESLEPASCGARYNSSHAELSIGECIFINDLSTDDCEDGFLSFSWTTTWTWDNQNPSSSPPPCNETWPEGEDNLCHYDPINSVANCEAGSNVIACPAQIQLSFFSTLNIIAAVILLVTIYYLLKREKKTKKKKK